MKRLSEYLKESIFDMDEKDVEKNIKASISKFLKANYKGTFSISKTPNRNGKYVVDSREMFRLKIRKLFLLLIICLYGVMCERLVVAIAIL